jgi:hypothetical protein
MSVINVLPNPLLVNVVKRPDDGLAQGSYVVTEFKINKNERHQAALDELFAKVDEVSQEVAFFKRGAHSVKSCVSDDSISLMIFSKLPNGSRFKIAHSDKRSFAFYQDIVDMRYDGDATATLAVVGDSMTFKIAEDIDINAPQPLCYNYPEAVLWDLLEFINVLSMHILVEGFEEGILIGPAIVEIE